MLNLFQGSRTYVGALLTGLIITLLVTPLVIRLARRFGAVDKPNHRKVHATPVPLWGGIGVFLGMWVPLWLLMFRDNGVTNRLADFTLQMGAICVSGFIMLVVGAVDDKRGIGAKGKLMVQVPLAIALVMVGLEFDHLNLPFWGSVDLGPLGPVISVLWIIGVTNAINLVDGIDGLAAGVAFFVAATNAIVALNNGNDLLAVTMFSLTGACLGFLRYNFNPAKIFLGDTGSLFIGMTLASTSVAANVKSTVAASMLIPVIVLGFPVLDTLLAIARRSLRGKPIFSADKGHIHHRLLARGLGQRHAVLVIYIICLLLSLTALSVIFQSDVALALCLFFLFALLFIGARFLGFFEHFSAKVIQNERPHFRIAHLASELAKEKVRLAESVDGIVGAIVGYCDAVGFQSMEFRIQRPESSALVFRMWTRKPEMGAKPEPLRPDAALREEVLFHPDLGLSVRVQMWPLEQDDEDLDVEQKLLLGQLVKEAHDHLLVFEAITNVALRKRGSSGLLPAADSTKLEPEASGKT